MDKISHADFREENAMRTKLHVIFPSYFDSACVSVILPELKANLTTEYDLEIYLLDDSGGEDQGLASLKSIYDIQIIAIGKQIGHQAAFVKFLRGKLQTIEDDSLIVTMDADGEDQVKDIPAMLEILQLTSGVVLAKRISRQRSLSYNFFFGIYRMLFKVLTGTIIETGNFAAFKARDLKSKISLPVFNDTYAGAFYCWPERLQFYECPKGKRIQGESRMSPLKILKHAYQLTFPFHHLILKRLLGLTILCLLIITVWIIY